MLLQVFYILFFYFAGECISQCIHGFIPGSVIGMVLLFLALAFKVVKPCHVNKISKLLTDNMGLFFLPAGVGLLPACRCGPDDFYRCDFALLGGYPDLVCDQYDTGHCLGCPYAAEFRKTKKVSRYAFVGSF